MRNMEHIKPGDRVLAGHHPSDKIATVERVTKTQIILRNGSRYRREDGREMGRDIWSRGYVHDITEDDILRITYRKAASKVIAALSTRNRDDVTVTDSGAYKKLLLDAKAIIDAALTAKGDA